MWNLLSERKCNEATSRVENDSPLHIPKSWFSAQVDGTFRQCQLSLPPLLCPSSAILPFFVIVNMLQEDLESSQRRVLDFNSVPIFFKSPKEHGLKDRAPERHEVLVSS